MKKMKKVMKGIIYTTIDIAMIVSFNVMCIAILNSLHVNKSWLVIPFIGSIAAIEGSLEQNIKDSLS